MPCPPCKIIINSGFMAVLAPRLADHLKFGDAAQVAAAKLGGVAKIHKDMLTAAGYQPSPEGFTGCEQAQKLTAWIVAGKVPPDGMALIAKWSAGEWSAIADLAAGKMPT